MATRVLIMGPPGSGKGTQAALICAKRGMAHISTGEMLREAMEAESPLGRQVKAVVERGDLVSDELMLDLVRARLEQDDCRQGFILDGYPRTQPQAASLLAMLDECGADGLEAVLLLTVPDEEIVERLSARGRTDDTRETIQHRLDVYRDLTEPVLRYLENRGVEIDRIDGLGTIEEITERIEGVLDAGDQAQEPA